jgi:hypothetical protein
MTADQIARLAIALDEVRPPVRRRIEVPLTIRLDRLHEVFQAVMGWENYHLYEFRIGRDIAYGVPDPNGDFLGSSSRPANRTTLAQLRHGFQKSCGRQMTSVWLLRRLLEMAKAPSFPCN